MVQAVRRNSDGKSGAAALLRSSLGHGREEVPTYYVRWGRTSATLFVHVLMGAGHACCSYSVFHPFVVDFLYVHFWNLLHVPASLPSYLLPEHSSLVNGMIAKRRGKKIANDGRSDPKRT